LNPIATDLELEHNQFPIRLEQLHNLEQRPSHRFGFQQHVDLVEIIMAFVVVQQTQPLHQIVWLSVPITRTIERPLVQRNISITTTQPNVEVPLTYAYYQQVGHEFKNCPCLDDKLKRLMKE